MSIYTRDNINYSQMLQNAIANRARAAEREAQYIQNQGKLWGDTAMNVGKYLGRGLFATLDSMDSYDDDEAELAELKAQKAYEEQKAKEEEAKNAEIERLNYINKQADNMSGYETKESINDSNLMNGYIPAEANPYTRGSLIYEPNYADVAQQNSVPLGYRPTYGIMKDYVPNEVNSYRHPYEEREYNPYDVYGMMQDYYRRGR